jgi:hypothetical protein
MPANTGLGVREYDPTKGGGTFCHVAMQLSHRICPPDVPRINPALMQSAQSPLPQFWQKAVAVLPL